MPESRAVATDPRRAALTVGAPAHSLCDGSWTAGAGLVPTPTVLAPGGRLLTTPAAFCLERSAVSQPELSVWPTASLAP